MVLAPTGPSGDLKISDSPKPSPQSSREPAQSSKQSSSEEHSAASKIQARRRGQTARRQMAAQKQQRGSATAAATAAADAAEAKEANDAASTIQARRRGQAARRQLKAQPKPKKGKPGSKPGGKQHAEENAAASKIQARRRGQVTRRQVAQQRDAATKIQCVHRANAARRKAGGGAKRRAPGTASAAAPRRAGLAALDSAEAEEEPREPKRRPAGAAGIWLDRLSAPRQKTDAAADASQRDSLFARLQAAAGVKAQQRLQAKRAAMAAPPKRAEAAPRPSAALRTKAAGDRPAARAPPAYMSRLTQPNKQRVITSGTFPQISGGCLGPVLVEFGARDEAALRESMRQFASCGIFCAAQLLHAIQARSIPPPNIRLPMHSNWQGKPRLLNELLVTRCTDTLLTSAQLESLVSLAGSDAPGVGVSCPSSAAASASEQPGLVPQLMCGLLSLGRPEISAKLRRAAVHTADAFIDGTEGIDKGMPLLELLINRLLRSKGEKALGGDTLSDLRRYVLKTGSNTVSGCQMTGESGESHDSNWNVYPSTTSRVPGCAASRSDVSRKDFEPADVVYVEGTFPLILVVPHGGFKGSKKFWSDSKKLWSAFPDAPPSEDLGTLEMADAMRERFRDTTGGCPHMIVCHLSRSFVDVTVAIDDAVYEPQEACAGGAKAALLTARARAAWKNYHTQIGIAKSRCVSNGLVVELQAAGSHLSDPYVHLGYGLDSFELRSITQPDVRGSMQEKPEPKTISQAFEMFDMDRNGVVNSNELFAVAKELGVPMSEADVAQAETELDTDGNGVIDEKKFREWFSGLGSSGKLAALKVKSVLAGSGISAVAHRQVDSAQIVAGPGSLGGILAAYGCDALPSPQHPDPLSTLRQLTATRDVVSGGADTERATYSCRSQTLVHGSGTALAGGGNIDCLVLTVPRSYFEEAGGAAGNIERTIAEAFDVIDEDGSGTIDSDELKLIFRELGEPASDKQIEEAMEEMGASAHGEDGQSEVGQAAFTAYFRASARGKKSVVKLTRLQLKKRVNTWAPRLADALSGFLACNYAVAMAPGAGAIRRKKYEGTGTIYMVRLCVMRVL